MWARNKRIERTKVAQRQALGIQVNDNIIAQIIDSESTPSKKSNQSLFNDITAIVRQYLHIAWFLQSKDANFLKRIQEMMLILPLRNLFKEKIIEKFPSTSTTDDQIDKSIKNIFKDFLQKEKIEDFCISVLKITAAHIEEMARTDEFKLQIELGNTTVDVKHRKMAGVLSQLYQDAVLGYKLLKLDPKDIDEDNKDKLKFFNSITGNSKRRLSFACRDPYDSPVINRFYRTSTVAVIFVCIITALIIFINQCVSDSRKLTDRIPRLFLLDIGLILVGSAARIYEEMAYKKMEIANKEKETYLPLVDKLVSLLIVDSLAANLAKEEEEIKRQRFERKSQFSLTTTTTTTVTDEDEKNKLGYESNSFFHQTPSVKRQKTMVGKDKSRKTEEDTPVRKLNEMKKRINASINDNFPLENTDNVDPTWFNGKVSVSPEFKPIENSTTGDYFTLLQGVDAHQDSLFEKIDVINFSDLCLKRLSTSTSAIIKCTYQNENYDMEVRWELKSKNTKDRILVGRIFPDDKSSSSLYVGFKYIDGGFHDDKKLNRVLAGLSKTVVDLNSLPTNTVALSPRLNCI